MERKAKYGKELKLEIIKRYLKGESASALVNEYGMKKIWMLALGNGHILVNYPLPLGDG